MTDRFTDMDPVALLEEVRKLDRRINNPITDNFIEGVRFEAAHQVERWGAAHDRGKTGFDWFWLIGYLAQKAATSAVLAEESAPTVSERDVDEFILRLENIGAERVGHLEDYKKEVGELLNGLLGVHHAMRTARATEKALHHTISTAAALLNWHAQLQNAPLNPEAPMRPGTDLGGDNASGG